MCQCVHFIYKISSENRSLLLMAETYRKTCISPSTGKPQLRIGTLCSMTGQFFLPIGFATLIPFSIYIICICREVRNTIVGIRLSAHVEILLGTHHFHTWHFSAKRQLNRKST